MTKIELIKDRTKRLGFKPLKFRADFNVDGLSAREAFIKILHFTYFHHTYNFNGRYQCRSGSRRSVGDMWRLMLHYYSPDITLFEVMNIFYDVADKELVTTWYCSIVRKFVMVKNSHRNLCDSYRRSEYGISLLEYKDIKEVNDEVSAV